MSLGMVEVPTAVPFELIGIEKTGPVTLLEGRRSALLKWLKEGEQEMAQAEASIKKCKQDAIEMMAELEEIERALNILEASAKQERLDG